MTAAIQRIDAHYRKIQPDLIFHYTIKAILRILAAARTACPSVSVITGLGYAFSGNPCFQTSVKTIYRRVCRKMPNLFLNSDDQRVFVTEKLIRKEKTFLLPEKEWNTGTFYPGPV